MPGPLYGSGVTIMPATQPTFERCSKTIYDGMISACNQPGGYIYPASVNLQVLPTATGNGLPAPGGKSYPSYYISNNVTGTNPVVPNSRRR